MSNTFYKTNDAWKKWVERNAYCQIEAYIKFKTDREKKENDHQQWL